MSDPIQQRGHETRQRILEAAIDEFATRGFHGARVATIAAAAGVNKQRIYAYFEDKEGLFTAVLRHAVTRIAELEVPFRTLGEEAVPHLGTLLFEHAKQVHTRFPDLWRILAWENLDGGRHAHALRGIRAPGFTHLQALYEAGQRAGYYPQAVSFAAYLFAIFAVTAFVHSNRHTMAETLGLPLEDAAVRARLWVELGALFTPGGAGPA